MYVENDQADVLRKPESEVGWNGAAANQGSVRAAVRLASLLAMKKEGA